VAICISSIHSVSGYMHPVVYTQSVAICIQWYFSQWLYASSSIHSVSGYMHPVIFQSVVICIQCVTLI
jgi:hypothetical protein